MKSTDYSNLDLTALDNLAFEIASHLTQGSVIALTGDLGAGKTTFSGMIINHLTQKQEDITSPTFNLVHNYSSPKGQIWHFDLYRLKHMEEVYALGIEDAFHHGISIIEWPEIIENLLPINALKIQLSFGQDDNLRNVSIIATN
jgi:tRNA threonylcarbamoyl adenosine modification protein YjeE